MDAGILGVWDEGYYWVPGVWVQPPTVGYLVDAGVLGLGRAAFMAFMKATGGRTWASMAA